MARSKLMPRSKAQARRSTSKPGGSRARGRSQGQLTVDHDEIRDWVESRGGTPATVEGTKRGAEGAGLLRIDFPGYSGEGTLTPVG